MKKTKNQKRASAWSFVLGLPFSVILLALDGYFFYGAWATRNQLHDESIAFLCCGIGFLLFFILFLLLLKASMRRKGAGIFMVVLGTMGTAGMVGGALTIRSQYDSYDLMTLLADVNTGFAMLIGGILVCLLLLIGGIVSIRGVSKLKKELHLAASPWLKDHAKAEDLIKNGSCSTEENDVIGSSYSAAFYCPDDLRPFRVTFPDATVLYRQRGILRIKDRLFVAGSDLGGDVDPETVFFFEVSNEDGTEKLIPIFADDPVHRQLARQYAALCRSGRQIGTDAVQVGAGAIAGSGTATAFAAAPIPAAAGDRTGAKARKVILLIICILYGITLLLSVLTMATGFLDSTFSPEEEKGRAYGLTMGFVWLTSIPSFLYYFAFVVPFAIGKKCKAILVSCGVALSAVVDILFFVVTKNARMLLDASDTWFLPFTVVAGSVCVLICYILTALKINPAAIRTLRRRSVENAQGLFEIVKSIFTFLVNCVLKGAAILLGFVGSYTTVFALFVSVLFTLLLPFTTFVVAIVIGLLLLSALFLFFAGALNTTYEPTAHQVYSVYEDGYERTLVYDTYDPSRSCDRYRDDTGRYWYTNDDGATFFRE